MEKQSTSDEEYHKLKNNYSNNRLRSSNTRLNNNRNLNIIYKVINKITTSIKYVLTFKTTTIFIIFLVIFLFFQNIIMFLFQKNSTKFYASFLSHEKSIISLHDYCLNYTPNNSISSNKIENPKISLIIPIYNKQNYISKVICSIQNQTFNDIEIIFIDDLSTDNSTNIIKNFQQKDKRIILISHNENKGTLITRNDGALNAKGEYIMFIDPDDMIIENILNKTYYTAKSEKCDIVQFESIKLTNESELRIWSNHYRNSSKIIQPKLSEIMFYLDGYLKQNNYYIWGKLIDRKIFLKAIKTINNYYLEQHMTLYEDGLILYALLKNAESYIYIKEAGYLYDLRIDGIMYHRNSKIQADKTAKDIFLISKFLLEYSDNNFKDKKVAIYFMNRINNEYALACNSTTRDFQFYYDILDLFDKCDYIIKEDKKVVNDVRELIKIAEKNI